MKAPRHSSPLSLTMLDVSDKARFGCKGPGALAWLAGLGLPTPPRPNTWLPLAQGPGLVARLGQSEFLVEWSEGADSLPVPVRESYGGFLSGSAMAGVYPVLRQDMALILEGTALPELLLQVCSVDFPALARSDRPVALTSLAGVGVTLLPERLAPLPRYRLWCDGSYGAYLRRTLRSIAGEMGWLTEWPTNPSAGSG